MWLGQPDPATSLFRDLATNPAKTALAGLLAALRDRFGTSPFKVAAVATVAKADPELHDLLTMLVRPDPKGDINVRSLGWMFRRESKRIADGLRIVEAGANAGSAVWRIEGESDIAALFDAGVSD